jgi:hypothetical protein
MIQLDLNSTTLAFKSSGATPTAVASYTVSQAEIVYESINPDNSLLDGIRMSMAQSGRLFELPYSTPLGLQTATTAGAGLSYNVGLNLASVSGVFVAEVAQSVEQATTAVNAFIRNSTEANTNYRRFYLDGKQMVNYDVWADSQNFLETQRALGSLLSLDNTTLGARANDGNSNYCATAVGAGSYYVVGQSGRRFAESDLCMSGTPCSNLVIQLGKTGASVASSVYINVLYDAVAVLDANGSCAVAK